MEEDNIKAYVVFSEGKEHSIVADNVYKLSDECVSFALNEHIVACFMEYSYYKEVSPDAFSSIKIQLAKTDRLFKKNISES